MVKISEPTTSNIAAKQKSAARWNFQFVEPCRDLQPYVRHFVIVESNIDIVNRIFPDTTVVMSFRFKGEVAIQSPDHHQALPLFAVSGLRKSSRLIHYSPNSGNLLVIFHDGAASSFIREPIHELLHSTLPISLLNGYTDVHSLEDNLSSAGDNVERIKSVERLLLSKLNFRSQDRVVSEAVNLIRMHHGSIRLKELAAHVCLSQDAFEKRFRKVIGTSPKSFACITRLKYIVEGMPSKETLLERAYDSGYFDQPHFNKDFKLFTGQTPTEFLQNPKAW